MEMTGHIRNKITGLVMGITRSSKRPGSCICTWTMDNNWDKIWSIDKEGYIMNVGTGLVMCGQDKGRGIFTVDKHGQADEKWRLTSEGHIENLQTNLVVAVRSNSQKLGASIVTWTKDGHWDKLWEFVPTYTKLSKQLGAEIQKTQRMSTNLEVEKQKVQASDKHLQKLKSDLQTANANLEGEKQKVLASDKKLQKLQADWRKEQEKSQCFDKQVQELASTNGELCSQLKAVEQENSRLEANCAEYRERGAVAQEDKVTHLATIADLQSMVKALELTNADFRVREMALSEEKSWLQATCAELQTQLALAHTENLHLEQLKVQLMGRNGDLSDRLHVQGQLLHLLQGASSDEFPVPDMNIASRQCTSDSFVWVSSQDSDSSPYLLQGVSRDEFPVPGINIASRQRTSDSFVWVSSPGSDSSAHESIEGSALTAPIVRSQQCVPPASLICTAAGPVMAKNLLQGMELLTIEGTAKVAFVVIEQEVERDFVEIEVLVKDGVTRNFQVTADHVLVGGKAGFPFGPIAAASVNNDGMQLSGKDGPLPIQASYRHDRISSKVVRFCLEKLDQAVMLDLGESAVCIYGVANRCIISETCPWLVDANCTGSTDSLKRSLSAPAIGISDHADLSSRPFSYEQRFRPSVGSTGHPNCAGACKLHQQGHCKFSYHCVLCHYQSCRTRKVKPGKKQRLRHKNVQMNV